MLLCCSVVFLGSERLVGIDEQRETDVVESYSARVLGIVIDHRRLQTSGFLSTQGASGKYE
jgi:hypothetical protein